MREYLVYYVDAYDEQGELVFSVGPFGDSDRQWYRALEALHAERERGRKAWLVMRDAPPWEVCVGPDDQPPFDKPAAGTSEDAEG